jgi:hypothetical protein
LLLVAALVAPFSSTRSRAQEQEPPIERPGPPALDDLEKDANNDGIPDGWYSARDATLQQQGGVVGPHFVRLHAERRGRPSGICRAFGIDGRKTEAVVIGLWVRVDGIQYGERIGQEPGLLIDFLGEGLRQLSRGTMGPWTHTVGTKWTRVVKRIPVQPGTLDAILSVGLMGAKGRLDFDGLSVELVPRAETPVTNLVVNGGFELGDPAPAHWIVNNEAPRVFPGHESQASIELAHVNSRVLTGLALPVDGLGGLALSVYVEAANLRASGGATATFFFLDEFGRRVAGGERNLEWSGSFGWRRDTAEVRVPPGATRAVLQFDKTERPGKIHIDDVVVTAAPNPEVGSWIPFHVDDDTDNWHKIVPSPTIAANSALDFSFLVPAPAGNKGFVTIKDGRLSFTKGGRARFHGVAFLPPSAFLEPERADELADRLARSGINLVRLGDLDMPLGPDRSLFDDTRDDTRAFDPQALAKLDHLVAALKARGIYVAVELQSNRRYRDGDGVPAAGFLPPGGGPAALFHPGLTKLAIQSARALLTRTNAETGLAFRDDPALAWVTLLGEVSLFDLIDNPDTALPADYAQPLKALGQKATGGTSGRRFWQSLEMTHYKELADALRKDRLRVPIAGCSHWRRESEFSAAQAGGSMDLIDDRLFWSSQFLAPEVLSQLWSLDGALDSGARRKRNPGLPYVVGQWCPVTSGAWALPFEAADVLLAAQTAMHEDWDALVRRGVFTFPIVWGEGPVGNVGGEDIFQVRGVVNDRPHVYALWPHVASIMLREPGTGATASNPASRRKPKPGGIPGWDPNRGRLVVDTPFTQGIAGWSGSEPIAFPALDVSTDNTFAVVVASSVGTEPIATSKRLLITAVGRVQPTGLRWVDRYKRDVADPGRAPLLQEPIAARVTWRRKGKIQAYALGNAGQRIGPAKLEPLPEGAGATLIMDGQTAAIHWELTVQ